MGFKIFSYEFTIPESTLDIFGHVNNSKYLMLFEDARWDFMSRGGFGIHEMLKMELCPIILSVSIDFNKELRARQCIKIQTQVLDFKKQVGRVRQWIEDSAGEKCTQATFMLGLFNLRTRQMVDPTTEWQKCLGWEEA